MFGRNEIFFKRKDHMTCELATWSAFLLEIPFFSYVDVWFSKFPSRLKTYRPSVDIRACSHRPRSDELVHAGKASRDSAGCHVWLPSSFTAWACKRCAPACLPLQGPMGCQLDVWGRHNEDIQCGKDKQKTLSKANVHAPRCSIQSFVELLQAEILAYSLESC